MSIQSVALASLTATYTDSEGEDAPEVQGAQGGSTTPERIAAQNTYSGGSGDTQSSESSRSGRSSSSSPNEAPGGETNLSNAPTLVTDVKSKVQRLVSYFDDTVVSDEEGNAPTHPAQNGKLTLLPSGLQSPLTHEDKDSDVEPDEYGVVIPPEPPGLCPSELQDKITNLYKKMESGGLDMNQIIQQRKDFRNPSIYEKLIQFCGINELGTNYPPDRFDPFKWGKDSYYEELAKVQKTEMDKLEKARKEKTKIEIVSGTAKRSASVVEEEAKRRKSKWDQVATTATSTAKSAIHLSQPMLTTLTASATGTKTTVLSAFGSLPKKRL